MLSVASMLLTLLPVCLSFGPCPADRTPTDCIQCISDTVNLCIRCEPMRRPSLAPVDGVCISDRTKINDACTDTGLYQDFGTCMYCGPGWFLHGYNNITEAEGGCFKCDNVAAGGIANCYLCTHGNMNVSNQVVRAVCQQCKAGYTLSNNACVSNSKPKCKAGQQRCKACGSNGQCTACDDGYGLSAGSCVVCQHNCLNCNNNADVCTACRGTVLQNGKCVPCDQGDNMEGCYTCLSKFEANKDRCVGTIGGYWIKDDGTTAKCSKNKCVRCMNLFGKEYCTTCVMDYFVFDGVCRSYYQITDPSLKGCADGVIGMCRKCIGKDIYWFSDTCLTLNSTIGSSICRKIDQATNICVDCKEGFRIAAYGCQKCIILNCKNCTADLRSCDVCFSGYTPIKKDGKIVACSK